MSRKSGLSRRDFLKAAALTTAGAAASGCAATTQQPQLTPEVPDKAGKIHKTGTANPELTPRATAYAKATVVEATGAVINRTPSIVETPNRRKFLSTPSAVVKDLSTPEKWTVTPPATKEPTSTPRPELTLKDIKITDLPGIGIVDEDAIEKPPFIKLIDNTPAHALSEDQKIVNDVHTVLGIASRLDLFALESDAVSTPDYFEAGPGKYTAVKTRPQDDLNIRPDTNDDNDPVGVLPKDYVARTLGEVERNDGEVWDLVSAVQPKGDGSYSELIGFAARIHPSEEGPLLVPAVEPLPLSPEMPDAIRHEMGRVGDYNVAELARVRGLGIGLTPNRGDQNCTLHSYRKALEENATLISPLGHSQMAVDQWNEFLDEIFISKAMTLGQRTRMSLFWHGDIGEELQAIWDQKGPDFAKNTLKYMDRRIDDVLGMIQRSADKAELPIENVDLDLIIGNEAMWVFQGKYLGWEEKYSPYYQALGKDWLVESYVRALDASKRIGISPRMIYNDYLIDDPHQPKAEFVRGQLVQTRRDISQRMQVNPDEVCLTVGIQGHLKPPGNNDPYRTDMGYIGTHPYNANLRSYSDEFGPIVFTEVDIHDNDQSHADSAFSSLVANALDLGPNIVSDITFWESQSRTSVLFEENQSNSFVMQNIKQKLAMS